MSRRATLVADATAERMVSEIARIVLRQEVDANLVDLSTVGSVTGDA